MQRHIGAELPDWMHEAWKLYRNSFGYVFESVEDVDGVAMDTVSVSLDLSTKR